MTSTVADGDVAGARRTGFRPTPRRRARLAAGLALAALAVGGNVLLYSSLDDTEPVVQLTRDVRPGAAIELADVRVVDVDLDPTVPAVPGTELSSVVGQFARVHLSAGTLLVDQLVQPTPLVTSGASVVALDLEPGRVPAGVRERSRIAIVLSGPSESASVIEARVVARGDAAEGLGGADGSAPMSVEVAAASAATVAAADDVRIVLLDPGLDPVMRP